MHSFFLAAIGVLVLSGAVPGLAAEIELSDFVDPTIIDFEDTQEFERIDDLYSSLGVTFVNLEGFLEFDGSGVSTVASNTETTPGSGQFAAAEAKFAKPIIRVGFDIATNPDDDTTFTASLKGVVVGTVTVDTGFPARFVGLEFAFPFDKLVIDPVNTVNGIFLIDNFRFEQAPAADGSGQGDPHFKTWRGHHYDYHGACDLVFLHSSAFESGLGLDVHIRTKIRRDMSYISSAALRIGSDVLEVESQGVYYLNGVLNATPLPAEFSGFAFSHTQPTDKQHVFEVHLGGRERIKLKTYKDFVSVLIEQGKSEHFQNSVGLMGDFGMGHLMARDGHTVLDDANAFGQEWQVLDTEATLFQTVRFPQHPQKCTMPTPETTNMLRRRLAETSSVDEAAAEKACEHWGDQGKDDCVFDVLTTGDLEMAVVGAY